MCQILDVVLQILDAILHESYDNYLLFTPQTIIAVHGIDYSIFIARFVQNFLHQWIIPPPDAKRPIEDVDDDLVCLVDEEDEAEASKKRKASDTDAPTPAKKLRPAEADDDDLIIL